MRLSSLFELRSQFRLALLLLLLFGLLYYSPARAFVIKESELTKGGAFYVSGTDVSINSDKTISMTGNTASSGDGGVFYFNKDVELKQQGSKGLILQSNSANKGGTIYFSSGSNVVLDVPMSIQNNTATYGGVFSGSGNYSISGSGEIECSGNNATNGTGGDFAYISGSTVNLGGNFSSSGGRGTYGGAMYIINSDITFDGKLTLTDNQATIRGGAIYYNKGTLTFTDNCDININKNIAGTRYYPIYSGTEMDDGGGGIYLFSCNIFFNGGNVIISENKAVGPDSEGGGMSVWYSNLYFNGTTFQLLYNSSLSGKNSSGGGADWDYSTIYLNKGIVTIKGNKATGAGGVWFYKSSINRASNFNFIDSTGNTPGSALYGCSGVTITN